jgi:hypothetical protein
MKINIIIIGFFLAIAQGPVAAQDYSELEKISLRSKTECAQNEKLVLECCDYLLESTINSIGEDKNHSGALQFILRWMEATPDYSFTLDETMIETTSSNPSLLGILLVSMSKYALENKTDDADDVKYNSFLRFIEYCEDPDHKVNMSRELEELIKARNENSLKEYLKIGVNGIITLL